MPKPFLIIISFTLFAILSLTLHFGYNTTPVETGKYLSSRFAAGIGMSVEVPSNPLNTLASQLEEKEEELERRGQELDEREATLLRDLKKQQRRHTAFLFGGMLVILALLMLNFYFDYHRPTRNRADR